MYIANRALGSLRKFSAITNNAKSLIWLLRLNKLKKNTTLWLSANLKDYRFLLPYLPYT
jgi:hypothetical protein